MLGIAAHQSMGSAIAIVFVIFFLLTFIGGMINE
jgi:hypothetical protein